MFKTVSFHIIKPCNMSCKFCYATFQDFKVQKQLDIFDAMHILDKLRAAGVEKVTFAGGEPLLYKNIKPLIIYAKEIGFTTSIITNGTLLSHTFLIEMRPFLDWIGISIDSMKKETNSKIGRVFKPNQVMTRLIYKLLVNQIKYLGYKLKINTVVNAYNQDESLQEFIEEANPERWKIFDTLRVAGQNDAHWEEIKSTRFYEFVGRHSHPNMVVENNELMTSSYVLIDPLGRMFENTLGTHTYSDSLLTHSVEHCLTQISLSEEKFLQRGGIYNW